MFISLEGSEGAGKSSLIESLIQSLKDANKEFVFSKEPGATEEGKSIRKILLDKSIDLDPYAETFLLLADRSQHVKKIIYPAIDKGIHVLTDRYIDSTYAYQGAGRGINEDVLNYLFKMLNFPIPDLTIFLDIPVIEGLERVQRRGEMDRFEKEEITFFERIRESYLFRAKQEPERFFIIDARKPQDEVHKLARDCILNKLKND